MPVASMAIGATEVNVVFLALVLVSLVHSIVLMRVCMHIIDRVYPGKGNKDQ